MRNIQLYALIAYQRLIYRYICFWRQVVPDNDQNPDGCWDYVGYSDSGSGTWDNYGNGITLTVNLNFILITFVTQSDEMSRKSRKILADSKSTQFYPLKWYITQLCTWLALNIWLRQLTEMSSLKLRPFEKMSLNFKTQCVHFSKRTHNWINAVKVFGLL